MYSKIIDFANCKTLHKRQLDVSSVVLIRYCFQEAKTRGQYKSTQGPTGLPFDIPSNADGLGDFHPSITALRVGEY